MVRLGGLYKQDGSKGPYISGPFGNARLVILPNRHKTGENDPDFIMYIKSKNDVGGEACDAMGDILDSLNV